MLIGIDTGGTFTDIVYRDGNKWKIYKLLSTPWNPAEAVLNGIAHVSGDTKKDLVHGSTVATNTLLERDGALTAIITNRGFEDIIEIGRQDRSRIYDLSYKRPPCLVSKENRFGIKGRINHAGEEIEPLDPEEIRSLIGKLKNKGIESIAVCLLFSYAHPRHELLIEDLLKDNGTYFSLSHKIVAEFREYERFSTTVANSYVGPRMSNYIKRLKEGLGEKTRLMIMQSNGGSISAAVAMQEPVRTVFSGPAGGVVAAHEWAKRAGFNRIISFDMGGTSTDVSLIDRGISITTESEVSEIPIKTPMIDIKTVGAGGGSIAHLDPGGSLRVGPRSAGADPGPICYGKGKEITVTDANLYLGRLIPEYFLGGDMGLHRERLNKPFHDMAKKVGLTPVELAEGIIAIANSSMQKAIRAISVERGHDPRDFTLFSFGGAGGMHAAYLARLLHIPKIIVPENPGLLSAMGMLMADIIKDYSLTIMKSHEEVSLNELLRYFQRLSEEAISDMKDQGIDKKDISVETYLDMRYKGQSYEIIVPFDKDYVERFQALHQRLYGYKKEHSRIEIVNLRIRAKGKTHKPEIKEYELYEEKIRDQAFVLEKEAIFDGRPFLTPVIKRDRLLPGNVINGPAIIVEYSSTIIIPPFARAQMDKYRNIIIHTL